MFKDTYIMNNISNLVAKIKSNGCRFISFVYTNTNGEKSRYKLQTGFSYESMVEKSLLELSLTTSENEIESIAIDKLKESFEMTLNGSQDKYTKKGYYSKFTDKSGEYVSGLKINNKNNKIHLNGLIHSKVVISKGNDKKNSISKNPVIAKKNEIRKTLPISKFREFKLDMEVLSTAKMNGDTLIFQ